MANNFYANPENMFRAMGAGIGPGSLPMPRMVSAVEVRRQAKARSKNILDCWILLETIMDCHEATIQRRWSKKTKQQRLRVLLNAWPNMAVSHRPDFEAFRKETETQRLRGTRYRDAFLWPHVNQEDLSNPRTLLLLLNSRGRHHPSDFAATDGEAMHLGHISKAIVPTFLNEYTMVLNRAKTPSEYGKLLSWEDHEDAFNWMITRLQYQPGEGLLILEVQERLMSFLTNCCKQLLHDLPADSLVSDQYPSQPEPPSKSESGTGGFDSLTSMAAEAPYRPPSQINFDRIVSLLAARESAAEDHLWSLREDPGYFAERLNTLREHRQELLKDTVGQEHPLIRLHRDEVLWSRIISGLVSEAHLSLEVFAELRQQAKKLYELKSKHASEISQSQELPEEYLNALLRFRHYLDQASKGPLDQLKHCLVASPPWRPFFVREPPPDSITPKIATISKPGMKMDSVQTQLLWLLRVLWEDDQQLFFLRKPAVVDELQRLINAEKKADEMISEFIASQISDLSICGECLRQLDLYQPWANNFEEKMLDQKEAIMQEFANRTRSRGQMLNALNGQSGYVHLGDPTDRKFYYPVDRRRNKENVETMRKAESYLDAFWVKIDQLMQRNVVDLKYTAVGKLLSQSRIVQRTPEWVDSTRNDTLRTDAELDELVKPLSELYYTLQPRTSIKADNFEPARSKEKTKTRGQPAAASTASDPNIPAGEPTASQPTFAVDARALKVFRILFYTPSFTATPGEVPWNDFLHAMVSTGFRAEKLHGSAWQFKPTKLDVERAIQFHEPHPVSKIPYRHARIIGRRLFRTYGWLAESFTLMEKAKQEPTG